MKAKSPVELAEDLLFRGHTAATALRRAGAKLRREADRKAWWAKHGLKKEDLASG